MANAHNQRLEATPLVASSAKAFCESPDTTPDLTIGIWPREWTDWEGTAQQLVDEGLITGDFDWPLKKSKKVWSDGKFRYDLRRSRPAGLKGPMSVWVNGDWWSLRRTCIAHSETSDEGACVYLARRAYEDALWRQTAECSAFFKRYWAAHSDQTFQSFLAQAMGAQHG